MGTTDFPNGITSMGSPVTGGGLPATFGKYFYVNPTTGSDGNKGTSMEKPFASISAAYSAVTSGNHDVIVLSADAAHVQTAMLTFTKSRFHIVSASNRGGSLGMGARSRITMGVTAVAADIAVMQNTGVGCTFTGLKFESSNTKAESLYSVAEGGEYSIYRSCEFYKSTDLDETAAAEVLNNGDSAQWFNCYFGSTANITAAAKIRANMLLTATLAGKKCRDNYVYGCVFVGKAADTAQVKVYGANATDVERMFLMENCVFLNNLLSAGTPAHAVGFGAAQTQGSVFLKGCSVVDHTVMAQAAVGIAVDGAVPGFATTGVSVTA